MRVFHTKNLAFRAVNVVGFAANAAAIRLPYGSAARQGALVAAAMCHFTSTAIAYSNAPSTKNTTIGLASLMAGMAVGTPWRLTILPLCSIANSVLLLCTSAPI